MTGTAVVFQTKPKRFAWVLRSKSSCSTACPARLGKLPSSLVQQQGQVSPWHPVAQHPAKRCKHGTATRQPLTSWPLQSLLCGVLQVVVQKLTETESSKAEVMRSADGGMDVLLAVLRSQQTTVNEEALLAVGAFTYACGASFQKYLEALMPFILLGLQNYSVRLLTPCCACLRDAGESLHQLAQPCLGGVPPWMLPAPAPAHPALRFWTRPAPLMFPELPALSWSGLGLNHPPGQRGWPCCFSWPACALQLRAALQGGQALTPPPLVQEQQVCLATVGVLGDICRAVEAQVAPYCDNIMTQLLANLKSSAVARGLKPPILSCFGDIALALGSRYEPYLTHVLSVSRPLAALTDP